MSYTSGILPTDNINKAILNIEIAIDNAITEDKETADLIALKNDLEDIKKICYAASH